MSALDRKLELERKKAKLAALREQKAKRENQKTDILQNGSQPDSSASENYVRLDAEELLKTLGLTLPEPVLNGSGDHSPKQETKKPNSISRPRRTLAYSKIEEVDFAPKDSISYSKEVQTKDSSVHPNISSALRSGKYFDSSRFGLLHDSPRDALGSPRFVANLEWDDEFSMVLGFDGTSESHFDGILDETSHTPMAQRGRATTKHSVESDQPVSIRTLTDEEQAQMIQSEKFCSFFNRASRLIERALDEPADIFVDYSGADHDDTSLAQRHQLLRFGRDFFDERWSRRRCVTSLNWSPTYPELLLAAYHSNEDAPHEPHGVCLIWNLKFQKSSPEYIFHCQSPVTSATMAVYHPSLVIGGTYSGQIVIWDNRCMKRTPVQRTVISSSAHTHPVHAVQLVGTTNAHNLVSVSSDGKMCSWSLDMLSQPHQSMELIYRPTKQVAATSLSFLHEDFNNFLVGSEDGRVYVGSRHGNQAGISEMLDGHEAPITSISAYSNDGPVDFTPLFLTTSFDWTVKLWNLKDKRPIYSFDEASDIVLDADWSPLHPAMFATVYCSGRLDLWNLNEDTEVPVARTVVDGQLAVNKCRFHSSGLHIAAGDRNGRIHVYDLNENMVAPHADEWNTFAHTVEELRQLVSERSEPDAHPPPLSHPLSLI